MNIRSEAWNTEKEVNYTLAHLRNMEVSMISGCAQEGACAREGFNFAHAYKKDIAIIGDSMTHAH